MTCHCPPCIADEELFGAGDTEPAPPRESSTFLWHGKDCGPNGWRECYECEKGVMSHDCDVYAIGDKQRWICGWCLGWPQLVQQDEEEKMASLQDFHATVKAIAKSAGRGTFSAEVAAHEYDDGHVELTWRAYIDGFHFVAGCDAASVIAETRKMVRGETPNLAELGTPPEPRAA